MRVPLNSSATFLIRIGLLLRVSSALSQPGVRDHQPTTTLGSEEKVWPFADALRGEPNTDMLKMESNLLIGHLSGRLMTILEFMCDGDNGYTKV